LFVQRLDLIILKADEQFRCGGYVDPTTCQVSTCFILIDRFDRGAEDPLIELRFTATQLLDQFIRTVDTHATCGRNVRNDGRQVVNVIGPVLCEPCRLDDCGSTLLTRQTDRHE
jgi:hypothetical protein